MFSSKCETFAVHVAYAWVEELFSKRQAQVHVKKLENFWFELATMTSQVLKFDVIKFYQHVAILFKSW